MTPRRRRMMFVALILLAAGGATAFALSAFKDNVLYYYTPTQLLTNSVPQGRALRIGGMVSQGSVHREPGSLDVKFVITDFAKDVPVSYSGVLPDLFREGQGVIVRGRMDGSTFAAQEVLAKHDEKYMPPDISDSVRKAHDAKAAAMTTAGNEVTKP
jgi:cytochrome c-type biogenesis protein CcmE